MHAGFSRRHALVAGGALVGLGACGRVGQRPLLSSDTHPEGYPTVEAVKEMARILREGTGGEMDIRVYAGGQLGAERDTLEITVFGGLDLNRVNLAPLASIEPTTVVPSLPFLFRSTDHMRRALDGAPGEEILASLEPHGLVGLCFYDSGERSFYTTKRGIQTPADMRGLKIRVPNSDLYVAMIKALGADATPMDLGEAYQALLQGVIDGAENNWPSYDSGRHFEAAPHYSLTRHMMTPEILVMSASRWKRLDEGQRAVVRDAARASVGFMRSLWDQRVEASRLKLIEAGVNVHEIPDQTAFVDAVKPVWERFVATPKLKRLVSEIEGMDSQ